MFRETSERGVENIRAFPSTEIPPWTECTKINWTDAEVGDRYLVRCRQKQRGHCETVGPLVHALWEPFPGFLQPAWLLVVRFHGVAKRAPQHHGGLQQLFAVVVRSLWGQCQRSCMTVIIWLKCKTAWENENDNAWLLSCNKNVKLHVWVLLCGQNVKGHTLQQDY